MQQTGSYRPDLSILVSGYSNNLRGPGMFMGRRIAPAWMVPSKKAWFDKIAVSEMLKTVGDIEHAAGADFQRIKHKLTQDAYECLDYGLEEPIPDVEAKDVTFNQEVKVGQALMRKVLVKEEIRWATLLFNTATFAGKTSGVNTEWDNVASTPIADVQAAKLAIVRQMGGFMDSVTTEFVLSVSFEVFTNLTKVTEVKAAARGGSGGSENKTPLNARELAQVLGVDRIEFSGLQNAAADVWDDEYALLSICPKIDANGSASIEPDDAPHLARTPVWDKIVPEENLMETYSEERSASEIVRVRQHQDEKVMNVECGYLLSNITT